MRFRRAAGSSATRAGAGDAEAPTVFRPERASWASLSPAGSSLIAGPSFPVPGPGESRRGGRKPAVFRPTTRRHGLECGRIPCIFAAQQRSLAERRDSQWTFPLRYFTCSVRLRLTARPCLGHGVSVRGAPARRRLSAGRVRASTALRAFGERLVRYSPTFHRLEVR
jgi:hypothetical protein